MQTSQEHFTTIGYAKFEGSQSVLRGIGKQRIGNGRNLRAVSWALSYDYLQEVLHLRGGVRGLQQQPLEERRIA